MHDHHHSHHGTGSWGHHGAYSRYWQPRTTDVVVTYPPESPGLWGRLGSTDFWKLAIMIAVAVILIRWAWRG